MDEIDDNDGPPPEALFAPHSALRPSLVRPHPKAAPVRLGRLEAIQTAQSGIFLTAAAHISYIVYYTLHMLVARASREPRVMTAS